MKKILFFIFFFLVTHTAKAETITIKFDDLPRLVAAGNGSVMAKESHVKEALSRKGSLKRSFLPQVGADGGIETFRTGNFDTMSQPTVNAHATINLFRGGKDRLEDKVMSRKHALAQSAFEETYLENLLRVRMLYADILFYEEQLAAVRDLLLINQDHRSMVQKQIDAGLATETDRLEFMMQANRLKQEKLLFEEDHEHAIQELKAVLDLNPDSKLVLEAPNPGNIDQPMLVTSDGFPKHPEISRIRIMSDISRLQKKQRDLWWVPALDTYALYGISSFRERERTGIANRSEYVFGLNLSLNVFDGLKSQAESKALGFQTEGLTREKEQKSRELQTRFEKLQHELRTRKQLIELLNQNIRNKQKYMDLSSDEYSRGVRTASQLFSASQQLYDEKEKLAETKRDYIGIASALKMLMGD